MKTNKIALLSTTPVLRAVIYALVGIAGVVGIVTGIADPNTVSNWVDHVPSIAATVASVLALANIHPQVAITNTNEPVTDTSDTISERAADPTEEYRLRLLGANNVENHI